MIRLLVAGLLAAALATPVQAGPVSPGLVSEEWADWTPTVDVGSFGDGTEEEVWDFAQDPEHIMYACGKFSLVRQADGTEFTRSSVFAFHSTGPNRGEILPFAPTVTNDGGMAVINRCLITNNGTRLVIAGLFDAVNETPVSNIAALNLDGALVPSFQVSASDQVTDVQVQRNRLFLCGRFDHINGIKQVGIATVRTSKGAFDPYFREGLTGRTTPEAGKTGAYRCAVRPDGKELAAIVNVSHINGRARCQYAKFNLLNDEVRLQAWKPPIATCRRWMTGRDVDYNPSGSRLTFVSGGGAACRSCDRTITFRSSDRREARPVWVNRVHMWNGVRIVGDTTHAVLHTGGVIYTSGHFRFVEGRVGGDLDPVDRMGIAALGPAGNALAWRSDQPRCVGGKVLYATEVPRMLWAGLDCDPAIIGREAPSAGRHGEDTSR